MPPFLDVSEVLLDPEFADRVTVNQRAQTRNAYGEPVDATTVVPNVVGVICSASPTDLQRLDDNQRMNRVMSLVTKFRVQGPSPGRDADTVVWNGDTYVIIDVQPYPKYGAGFIQALMASMDPLDASPK